MELKQKIQDVLSKMEIKWQLDEDDKLFFRYQMKTIYVGCNDKDHLVSLVLYKFIRVQENEILPAILTCNKMTRESKLLKVFLEQSLQFVSASFEFYYTGQKSLETNLWHSIKMLEVVNTYFKKTTEELAK